MNGWIRRNTFPILATAAAAALVIAGFEVIDVLVASPEVTVAAAGDESEAAPAWAGLIKVSLFLVVSIGATLFVRRRTGQTRPGA